MKTLLFTIALLVPVFCFGQTISGGKNNTLQMTIMQLREKDNLSAQEQALLDTLMNKRGEVRRLKQQKMQQNPKYVERVRKNQQHQEKIKQSRDSENQRVLAEAIKDTDDKIKKLKKK